MKYLYSIIGFFNYILSQAFVAKSSTGQNIASLRIEITNARSYLWGSSIFIGFYHCFKKYAISNTRWNEGSSHS
ncbi:MAG: hypothetical protein IPM69_12010 [Ignavibacteria bacterium]|nr:hypothetical protein [Ignavibacteria bacterium]